jgi:hypothetical protein
VYPEHVWLEGQVAYEIGALDRVDPAARGLLESRKIPTRFFFYFRSDGTVETVHGGSGRTFVRFGYTRDKEYICLAGDDLTVVEISPRDNSVISLAGSSLGQFLDIMAFCEDRYPYYTDEDDIDTTIEASSSLRRNLSAIDSEALSPGSYWSNFLSDVANGDYAVSEGEMMGGLYVSATK